MDVLVPVLAAPVVLSECAAVVVVVAVVAVVMIVVAVVVVVACWLLGSVLLDVPSWKAKSSLLIASSANLSTASGGLRPSSVRPPFSSCKAMCTIRCTIVKLCHWVMALRCAS